MTCDLNPFHDHSGCGLTLGTCVHFKINPRKCPTWKVSTNWKERTNVNENLGIQTNNTVAVGDLDSDAKGSGARKNAGKPQLDLIPVEFWRRSWLRLHGEDMPIYISEFLQTLDAWQKGYTKELSDWLEYQNLREAVPVLEFGASKYKAWNWAKGMPWSVCVGCILRHTKKILEGEETDPESGATHWGHILCNVIFLAYYADHYPEGDDRPPQ